MTAHPNPLRTAHPAAQELRARRWAAWASVVGGVLAAVLTSGVLAGAVLASYNALGDVGRAAHIPDLPVGNLHVLAVALDGLAGVALLTLIVLQPAAHMRAYCWALVGGCIAISMAANGAHAVFDDPEREGALALPVVVAFLISTVPAASAAAALHLILLIGHRLIEMVRTLVVDQPAQPPAQAPAATSARSFTREDLPEIRALLGIRLRREPRTRARRRPTRPLRSAPRILPALEAPPAQVIQPASPAQPGAQVAARPVAKVRRAVRPDAAHRVVQEALRDGHGYRWVVEHTEWGRPRAVAALAAAREAAQSIPSEPPDAQGDGALLPTFRDAPAMSGQGAAA